MNGVRKEFRKTALLMVGGLIVGNMIGRAMLNDEDIKNISKINIKQIEAETNVDSDTVEYSDNAILPNTSNQDSKNNDFVNIDQNVCLNKEADIYDTINGNIIDKLDIYSKAYEVSSNGTWDFIKYNDKTGYVLNSDVSYLGNNYVEVDISDQLVSLVKDNKLVISANVVTGKDSTPTIKGLYSIKNKKTDTYLNGQGYSSHVDYWMPFKGGYGLHDADWRSTFGGDIYHKKGSHGCVNMSDNTAIEIYNNVEIGTKVLVHN